MGIFNKILVLVQENLQYLDIRMSAAINLQTLTFSIILALSVGGFATAAIVARRIMAKEARGERVEEVEPTAMMVGILLGVALAVIALIELGILKDMVAMGKFYFLLK